MAGLKPGPPKHKYSQIGTTPDKLSSLAKNPLNQGQRKKMDALFSLRAIECRRGQDNQMPGVQQIVSTAF
jgi:hypothetical protein